MPSELTIELYPTRSRVIVVVAGEVDLCSVPGLAHGLLRASRLSHELVVDLEGVKFMDCAGLGVLMRWVGDDGGRGPHVLSVTPGPRQVQKLFELTGANRLVRVVSPDSLDVRPAA